MIQGTTLKYLQLLTDDPHHRYKSWEHNYLFFKENHKLMNDENVRDHASLHLAFYLASWGMLRGGSFLLQKDYKIHSYFIESIVANPKYWVFYSEEQIPRHEYISLVEELISETSKIYRESVTEINGIKKSVELTDTMVSKILLGVYGNVPAYDRYFKAAIKEQGISAVLSDESLNELFDFYEENELYFNEVAGVISNEVTYPPMKLIDMYFFTKGMEKDKSAQLSSFNKSDQTVNKTSKANDTEFKEKVEFQQVNRKGTIIESVRDFIIEKLEQEKATGAGFVDLKSGDVHRQLNFRNRLPIVCGAMYSIPNYRMEIIHETASKNSSTNVVRYYLN